MPRYGYDITAESAAPVDRVFAVLADAPGWREWAKPFVRRSMWEQEGSPPPGGVGAIRKLGAAGVFSREQILEYDPPRHLAYTLLSGQPGMKNYRADVRLVPDGDGTTIRWSGTFDAAVPGAGPVLQLWLRWIIGRFARGLARHAASRA